MIVAADATSTRRFRRSSTPPLPTPGRSARGGGVLAAQEIAEPLTERLAGALAVLGSVRPIR